MGDILKSMTKTRKKPSYDRTSKRIIVDFIPQQWVGIKPLGIVLGQRNESRVDSGESRPIDITSRILTRYSAHQIACLTSDSCESDTLVTGLIGDYDGPYSVRGVESALKEFFGVDQLRQITQDLLVKKRTEFLSRANIQQEETIKLRLIVDLEYRPNGSKTQDLSELLQKLPKHVGLRNMLTRGLQANIEKWDHKVEVMSKR